MARRRPRASEPDAAVTEQPADVEVVPAAPGAERTAVALLDQRGRVTLWSRAAELLTGVPAATAKGRALDFLYPPGGATDGSAEQHLARAAVTRRLTTVGPRLLATGIVRARMSLIALGESDRLRAYAMTLVPAAAPAPPRVPTGALHAALETSASLRRRARGTRALRRGEPIDAETLRAAFDVTSDALLVTNEYGMIVGLNGAASQLLGEQAGTVPHRPLFAFVPVNSRVAVRRLLLRLRSEPTVVEESLAIGSLGGPPVLVRATATLVQSDAAVGPSVYWTLQRLDEGGAVDGDGTGSRPHLLVAALEQERLRLSREIHDVLGQSLTALSLEVKALEAIARGARARERVSRVRALVASTSEQAHEIARSLRPTGLADLGLVRALGSYLTEWGLRTGVATDFLATGMDSRLPDDVETTLYRVAQEALTNVARHARAKHVSVVLERTPWQVLLVLDDDGEGFDLRAPMRPGARLGLLGARERVALVGGTLSVESGRGSGTSVFARVPLDVALARRRAAPDQEESAASSERKAP